jgi:uncharacterized membrane protein
VSIYDWLLFLHVLAAFSIMAGIVLSTYLVVASLQIDRPGDVTRMLRLARVGDVLWAIGAGGTLIFGVLLAIEVDGYALWDGWIVAALVIWFAVGALAGRLSKHFDAARDRARALLADGRDGPSPELGEILRSPRGLALHALVVALVVLLLIDMIWKPGA